MNDLRTMSIKELLHYAKDVHVSLDIYDRALIKALTIKLEELNDKPSTKN